MAASLIVRAQPICISISQAGADLKQLQVSALLMGLHRFGEESNSSWWQRLNDYATPNEYIGSAFCPEVFRKRSTLNRKSALCKC